MKAIVFEKYGPPEVLKLKEVRKPVPKNNEVLIKIHATPVTSGDYRMRIPDPFFARFITGFIHPIKKILGVNLAGEVESVGKNVTKFKIGDKVYGSTGLAFGAYAEYKCLPETAVISKMPSNSTYEEASAVIFGGGTALHFLEKGNIKQGQKVLIYGASGAVGTAAVQLLKHYGAEVTGVCSSKNIEMVQSLGAGKVIDYTKEDFTKNKNYYDIIYDTVGKTSFLKSKDSLKENGVFISNNASMNDYFQLIKTSIFGTKKIVAGVAAEKTEHLDILRDLIESGDFKSQIDKVYSLEEMAEAHRYVEKGHKKGNVVVKI
ncbi:NAD(P)-dependent alcohol dehydrogenase [Candidatus Gracilibacteria bacterium 28_42_T64]|nr:NAD(P)-dependent alcohol dehydrogenase [Candidatus Gracilibacteria bacterium 28_42_T64]